MTRYVVFAVNVGNLGAVSGPRTSMARVVARCNSRLAARGIPARIASSYRHTGNFIVECPGQAVTVLRDQLPKVLRTQCVVLRVDRVADLIRHLEALPPPAPRRGVRWTAGLVFWVSGSCRSTPLPPGPRATFHRLRPRVVAAWKGDAITNCGVLDRSNRMGGWGAVAADVSRQFGGEWTARSANTVVGLLRRSKREKSSS